MRRKVHGAQALESSEGAAGGGVSPGTRHANLRAGRPASFGGRDESGPTRGGARGQTCDDVGRSSDGNNTDR